MRKENSNQCETLSVEFLEELQSLQIFGGEGEGTINSIDQCTKAANDCTNTYCGCNVNCPCPVPPNKLGICEPINKYCNFKSLTLCYNSSIQCL